MSDSSRARPGPCRWLRYSLGGGLPRPLSGWVLHDTTCRTWVLRQILRSLLALAPLVLVLFVLIPGPFWIRGLAAFGGTLMSLFYSVGYAVETTEHRLLKAGYPAGTGEATRKQRSTGKRSEATARRRAKMFARIDKRRR